MTAKVLFARGRSATGRAVINSTGNLVGRGRPGLRSGLRPHRRRTAGRSGGVRFLRWRVRPPNRRRPGCRRIRRRPLPLLRGHRPVVAAAVQRLGDLVRADSRRPPRVCRVERPGQPVLRLPADQEHADRLHPPRPDRDRGVGRPASPARRALAVVRELPDLRPTRARLARVRRYLRRLPRILRAPRDVGATRRCRRDEVARFLEEPRTRTRAPHGGKCGALDRVCVGPVNRFRRPWSCSTPWSPWSAWPA